ncbi:translation initiation factor, aIF-2BI family [Solidesulfovibrio fructosivorans JJ]]|uniref:Methylthioribose-1-phosphate isomerase n=1 Tax=Solidesulfovibrio fructosivorans JJ] TaxID=596151 RepID=E1JZA7_SOLFR|nr:S-methyl-5-thioribose-1-phosphate isomerase [Solidesulfovibrio fructosivorans]EFL50267.1 translation initiation factor, aIF-2BI family [Solidesulfovibrio fructosivorans JJ]]
MTDHIAFSPDRHALLLLDQRFLPDREESFVCRNTADTIYALQTMVVRGAPAIGVTAAYGCYLAAREACEAGGGWKEKLEGLLTELESARPTAVNLRWGVERMRQKWRELGDISLEALLSEWLGLAETMQAEDIEINKAMGKNGAALIDDGDTVMTHCNAGALATAGYGTALGVIRAAFEQGKRIKVIANETRPFLQGARLTAYELAKEGIPVTVACDNAVGHLMKKGMVQKVVVGADRIAANGDAANKIGTYTVALAAKAHGVPFYVAAPASTFDLTLASGELIPIENRTPREVTHVGEHRITPEGVPVYNFAFDVTPAELIAGIITEKGVLTAPYTDAIRAAIGGK